MSLLCVWHVWACACIQEHTRDQGVSPRLARRSMMVCSSENGTGSQPVSLAWMSGGGKARADQREQDARRRRDERGVFESLPSAVCSLQPATCSFWTRRQLNCIERNGTGLQVAGLAGLNGLGLNSRREARPRWPLVRLGEGGESGWRAGGSRCGANVQARVGRTASTCRIWILEVVIKWSLNCAKGSASLAAPAALAFQGFAGVG